MRPVEVLAVSGSLRAESSNTKLLNAAAKVNETPLTITFNALMGQLPLFSPDLDAASIDTVQQWTQGVRRARGVIISTPEYARGYPGALKNALDWLVGGDGFVNKPFMFLTASARASVAQTTLATVLTTMSGVHIKQSDVTIPLLGSRLGVDDIANNREFAEQIQRSMQRFADAIIAMGNSTHG